MRPIEATHTVAMKTPIDSPADAAPDQELQAFIARWSASGSAERANKDAFLLELCDLLGVPRPDPATGDPEADQYVFEKDALIPHEGGRISTGKIDLSKQGCFILEAKQGSEAGATKLGTAKRGTAMWALAMQEAYGQALGYAQTFDAPPPFLVVCDIGHCFDLYATFDGSRHYRDFPDAQRHRIFLTDLPAHVELLRAIFTDPHRLDPAKRSARVTRDIAAHLAELARSLEAAHHTGEAISKFLMRCIFTMFAEDVGLLAERLFTDTLEKRWIPDPSCFQAEVESLWETMNTGGKLFGVGQIKQFNGGLFADPTALPLDRKQLERLLEASRTSWNDVEPAIFGTLLERALDPKERHALGAHFTPRAYVERLVRPTIEEPLRAEWDVVRAEVRQLVEQGKEERAVESVRAFQQRLCHVRVLDPACGTGNFLYVTLDLFKRLESEVLGLLADLGQTQAAREREGETVTPAQFHGIEIKPWAKEIAELVLWIGYLQWQLRTRGDAGHIAEPVLRAYGNIECRDAVLAYDRIEPVLDDAGDPVTRWDGETMKTHPVTGKDVPDETAQVPVVRYVNPRKAEWPDADFVVGNPPYIGNKRMRLALGDGYVEALRQVHNDVPDTADLVMYWWNIAAQKVRAGQLQRFGLITTNSITQTFNRRIVQRLLSTTPYIHIAFAIPDHPWVDEANGAAVRVAMTVGAPGEGAGTLLQTASDEAIPGDAAGAAFCTFAEKRGRIHPDLSIGPPVASVVRLTANEGVCFQGYVLVGEGFVLAREEASALGVELDNPPPVLRSWKNGRDLLQRPSGRFVIDFFGLTADQARELFPTLYHRVLSEVKPHRDHVARKGHREKWWIWGEARPGLRKATADLNRVIVTNFAAKHRVFVFEPPTVAIDHNMYVIASESAFLLGVLSSRAHIVWMLRAGSTLEDRHLWINSTCFLPFPFPASTDSQEARFRGLAEQLDAHRKRQQALFSGLTITGMYNVLEKLRSGDTLTGKEKVIHEQGLVSVLKQLHDELDTTVFDAYGWPHQLTDEQILERLVALNAERAEEERHGLIRWLRPEFQNPGGAAPQIQTGFTAGDAEGGAAPPAAPERRAWPKTLPERIAAVRDLLAASGQPWDLEAVTAAFAGAKRKDVEAVLDTLASLGLILAYATDSGRRWRAAT
jgi:hypothetical protein